MPSFFITLRNRDVRTQSYAGHCLWQLSHDTHHRWFWTRPGRTSSWWENFENEVVISEEWRENFHMSKTSLLSLSELLHPHIEGKTTVMRSPVSVVKKSCLHTVLFSWHGEITEDGKRLWIVKTGGVKIVRQVCEAITVHLRPVYIQLPVTESN